MGVEVNANPPPLVSPVAALQVKAVLDQDATLTAGLAIARDRRRCVLLMAAQAGPPSQREEFLAWGRALDDITAVARIAPIADYGHTSDGRAFLATYVDRSLVDYMRLTGQPNPEQVCGIGATIADALAATHSYGLVHGAVSPATVLVADTGVRLGGFGATAPGLAGPLGVWAFTAPEHRGAAASGSEVGTPAADVFGLAATICVVLAGALPWSDPTTWADSAGLPSGPAAPAWVTAVRDALHADPDQRPTAEEFATALRSPSAALPPTFHGAKVDLRALIPRAVRRLAANNMEAMADGERSVHGRATPSAGPSWSTRVRKAAGAHRTGIGVAATALVVLAAIGSYALNGESAPDATAGGPAASPSSLSPATLQLMEGARLASESFLRKIGAGDVHACTDVIGTNVITTVASPTPISCASLIANRSTLLPAGALAAMRTASVLETTGLTIGKDSNPAGFDGAPPTGTSASAVRSHQPTSDNNGSDGEPHVFVSLPYVPALEHVLNRLEITMAFHDNRWWVATVVFG
jgi:hypothetical protein